MFAISVLVRRHFSQDKKARQLYLSIVGSRRPTHSLNHLARQIEKGEIDSCLTLALLSVGVTVTVISNALEETEAKKNREPRKRFLASLKADFELVPRDQRRSHIPYFHVGAMTVLSLPTGIQLLDWDQQRATVKRLAREHYSDFYDDNHRSARDNYFGDIAGYHYEPAPHLLFRLSPSGELLL